MKARVLRLDEVTEQDALAWRHLSIRAEVPNVWSDPRFVLPALQWPGMLEGVHLVVVEEDEQQQRVWVGMQLLEVQRPVRRIPLTIATGHGRFMTWHSDRRHPLVAPGQVDKVLPMLVNEGRRLSSSRTLRLGEVPANPVWERALEKVGGASGVQRVDPRALMQTLSIEPAGVPDSQEPVDLPHSVEGVLSTAEWMTARSRTRLKKHMRGLERATGSEVTVVDLSDDADAPGTFIALQGRGWKGDPNRGGAGLILDTDYAAWFTQVIESFRADGDLAIFALESGGHTLAMQVALRTGSTWIGFVDTYDEDFQKFRLGNAVRVVGATLLTQDGQSVYDSGVAVRDGEGVHEYGTRTPVVDVAIAGGMPSRVALRLIDRAERWRARRDSSSAKGHS